MFYYLDLIMSCLRYLNMSEKGWDMLTSVSKTSREFPWISCSVYNSKRSQENIDKLRCLQHLQNAAAQLLTGSKKSYYSHFRFFTLGIRVFLELISKAFHHF